jgi:Activator of Hsp90 ATPase homolog 1-like protein
LSYSFHPEHDGLENERPSRVSFNLEEINGQVKLTMTHDDFDESSAVFPKIQVGWPAILSSLKSLLETGKELPPFWTGDYDKK